MTQWEKLLGGYATGTLSAEERALLMHAALSDQALFDLLMDEEALRETLADPATRTALLRALEPAAKVVAWWRNPWPWTGLGAVAAAVALVVILRPVDAPKPVQMAENRPAATAPVPVPAVIETPKKLRSTEPETRQPSRGRLPDRQIAPERTEPPAIAMAPPPAPAPEQDESGKARATAPAAAPPVTVQMAKKKEAVADASAEAVAKVVVEPLAVALWYQAEDGAWRAVDLAAPVPARRPLRLQVTSTQAGLLAMQPPIVEARTLIAGVPADIVLPAQTTGTLRLRLALFPRGPQALGMVANELRESKPAARSEAKATVLSAADSAVSASPTLTREIRLRIE
jgi:hypothetical protein